MATETIYLLCGVLCDAEVWQAQAAALGDRHEVRVVSFQTFETLGAMAEAVLAEAPERFALAGHSMGGRVALEIYRRAPARVARLALLDTGVEPAAAGEAERRAVLVDRAVAEGIDAVAEAWGRPMVGVSNQGDATLMARILAMVGRMSADIYLRQTRALLGRADARPVLSTITCPTLVLCGREDTWSPPERHLAMAAQIPGAQLELVEQAGHMVTMERPAPVLAALQDWLRASR